MTTSVLATKHSTTNLMFLLLVTHHLAMYFTREFLSVP